MYMKMACMPLRDILLTKLFMSLIVMNVLMNSSRALTCPEDQVVLTCHTNLTLLEWSILIADRLMPEERFISSVGSAGSQNPLFINRTEFQFLRTSTSPLKSTVLIDNVTAYLNGTRVECTDGDTTSTTVIVIGNESAVPNTEFLEYYGTENVTVFLQWANDGVLYNITINTTPYAPVKFNGNYSAQIIVSYNTSYNVSVVNICDQKIATYTSLKYVKCDNPLNQVNRPQSLMVLDYRAPALAGSTVNVICNCSMKYVTVEPAFNARKTLTCMSDGRWDFNSQLLKCRDIYVHGCGIVNSSMNIILNYDSVLENSISKDTICRNEQSNNYCSFTLVNQTCYSKTPPASFLSFSVNIVSVFSSILAASLFFTLGLFSGCLCHKYKSSIMKLCKTRAGTPSHSPSSARAHVSSSKQQNTQNLEMLENVAYGHLPMAN